MFFKIDFRYIERKKEEGREKEKGGERERERERRDIN